MLLKMELYFWVMCISLGRFYGQVTIFIFLQEVSLSGSITKLTLCHPLMQVLEAYVDILLADELFNYKIRNSFEWKKCGVLPPPFRSLFPPTFTGGKGSL